MADLVNVLDGTRPLVQRAFLNASALGTTTVAAAIPSRKIRVLALAVITAADIVVTFMSNSTAISAGCPVSARGGFVLPHNEDGWFETAVGEALGVQLGTSAATGVQVTYVAL